MKQPTCAFRKGITYSSTKHPDCDREHYKNGMCILHLEKQAADDGLEEEKKQIETDFLKALTKEIEYAKTASPDYELDWRGAHLPAIKFDNWIFSRRVLLTAARFEHGTSFSGCRFSGGLTANKCIFLGAKNNFIIDNCHFDDDTVFSFAVLGENPMLNGCVFNKKVTFSGCKLDTPDFLNNKFLAGVSFMGATFSGKCDFKTCEFHGEINFDSTINEGSSFTFRKSEFFGKLEFGYSLFFPQIHCSNFDFSDVKIKEKASLAFENLKLDTTSFERLMLSDGASLRFNDMAFGEGNFKNIEQRDKTAVSFSKVDLSDTTFLNTNIEKFNFIDITWCPIDLRLGLSGNRQGLVSEFDLLNKISAHIHDPKPDNDVQDRLLKEVELLKEVDWNSKNYRQLVKNSDAIRDYTLGENFHIGEMEMQRQKGIINGAKCSGLMRKLRSWNGFSIYKFISKYGTSYQHSLKVLVFFMVLPIAFLFLLSGLTDTECQKKNQYAPEGACNIQMTLMLTLDKPFIGFENIGTSILFTLGVATLQKDTIYKPATALGEFLRIFTILLVTGQAALTLFAVRRQFRRGGGSSGE